MLRHIISLSVSISLFASLFGCADKPVTADTASAPAPTDPTSTVEAVKPESVAPAKQSTKSSPSTPGAGVNCKMASDARSIETVSGATGGCETKYTKNGETQSVATAQNGMEYCQGVAEKIKNNLTTAGFSCE